MHSICKPDPPVPVFRLHFWGGRDNIKGCLNARSPKVEKPCDRDNSWNQGGDGNDLTGQDGETYPIAPFCRAVFVIDNPIHASTSCMPLEKRWAPAAKRQLQGRRARRQIPAESMATATTHEPAARSLSSTSGDGAECSQMQPHPAPVSRLNAASRNKPPGGWPRRPGGSCSACPVDMALTQEEPVGSG